MTSIPPSPSLHPAGSDRASAGRTWWQEEAGQDVAFTASEVLDRLEAGTWGLETPLRAERGGLAQPIRHWLRELATAARDEEGDEPPASGEVERTMRSFQLVARGVAHDVANILTAIRTSAELLQDELSLEGHEDIVAIEQATIALGALVDQLKDLSSPGEGASTVCDLREELELRLPVLRRVMSGDQRLTVDLEEGPTPALLDRTALHQVVLNLVVNASQAIDHDGAVVVRLRATPHEYRLEVEDDGPGMPPHVRRRALEPFFTTRPGGAGLGLAIVQAAVSRCHGRLEIAGEVGRGTCMRVLLPRALEPAAPATHTAPRRASSPPQRSEPPPAPRSLQDLHVILVDDDALLRGVLGRVLRRTVGRVTICEDGCDALDTLAQCRPRDVPHAILTDLAMPRMNGLELAGAVRSQGLELPIVLITAYPPPEPAR